MSSTYNPGLDPTRVYCRMNSEELIYGDGRPYIGTREDAPGAISWIYEPLTIDGLNLMVGKALTTAPKDQMKALYENNPHFRREVDKEVAKMLIVQIRFEARRTAERRRLKRKRRNQK